jgi:hypothetical protein
VKPDLKNNLKQKGLGCGSSTSSEFKPQYHQKQSKKQKSIRKPGHEFIECTRPRNDVTSSPGSYRREGNQAPMADTCNPSYSGGRDQED